MRVLLDESVPSRLRQAIAEHEVRSVVEMGWSGEKNGRLLALAGDSFDAFVTVDRNLPYQQNLERLPIAVVILEASSNELSALLPLVPALRQALISAKPGSCLRVSAAS